MRRANEICDATGTVLYRYGCIKCTVPKDFLRRPTQIRCERHFHTWRLRRKFPFYRPAAIPVFSIKRKIKWKHHSGSSQNPRQPLHFSFTVGASRPPARNLLRAAGRYNVRFWRWRIGEPFHSTAQCFFIHISRPLSARRCVML